MGSTQEPTATRGRYDVALSFAGEDRRYVEQVAETLKATKVSVFYDDFEEADLWGKNLYVHLQQIYEKRAHFVVVFISKDYAAKAWPKHELHSAQARALSEDREYILPARFDDTEIPGLPSTIHYVDLSKKSVPELCALIRKKLDFIQVSARREGTSNEVSGPVKQRIVLDPSTIARAITELRSLRKEDLRTKVMQPFFERIVYKVEADGWDEEYELDLILHERALGGTSVIGVRLDTNLVGNASDSARKKVVDATKVLNYLRRRSGNVPGNVTYRFYYISTADLGPTDTKEINKLRKKKGNIEVWDCERIIDELASRSCYDLLSSLSLWRIQAIKEEHIRRNEGVFAAHCAYRAACWYLENAEPPDLTNARECLREAIILIDGDPRRAAYYHRTLQTFYTALRDLLDRYPNAWSTMGLSRSAEITRYLDEHSREGDAFLYTTYYSVRQLYQLENQYVDLPTGLTSLQICNFLLRMGWSPILSTTIAKRINDAVGEMDQNKHSSIHDKCSLCTATAVSCFTLANLEVSHKRRTGALAWLRSLGKYRYCYHPRPFDEVAPGHHALHYAAEVLVALCDDVVWQNGDMGKLDKILKVFFKDLTLTEHGFYREWMKFRNISEFEICAYIFQGFLRFILAGGALENSYRGAARKALINLVKRLKIEGLDTPASWRLYAVRENVASLRLGLLLGVPECAEFLKKVTDGWHKDLCSIYNTSEAAPALPPQIERARADRLLDSNAGRLCVFLECLIQQWEGEFLSRSASAENPPRATS